MRKVIYSKEAARALKRLPTNTAATIRKKIYQYADDPASLGNNVKKLQGRGGFRLRVGDWRVIFDDDGQVMGIERIAPRGGAYD